MKKQILPLPIISALLLIASIGTLFASPSPTLELLKGGNGSVNFDGTVTQKGTVPEPVAVPVETTKPQVTADKPASGADVNGAKTDGAPAKAEPKPAAAATATATPPTTTPPAAKEDYFATYAPKVALAGLGAYLGFAVFGGPIGLILGAVFFLALGRMGKSK